VLRSVEVDMAMSLGYRKGEINVTPMIDVLLVLIIIFMVIQPPYSTGLQGDVPQDGAPGAVVEGVTIDVHSDGSLLLNRERVERAELEGRLRDLYRRAAEMPVFVSADKDADFGQVAEVMDVAKGVGIKRVGLMRRQ
jgi:biopolymer transport protein ExbD